MINLATYLQIAPLAATWAELKDMVSRFDTTAVGRLRLIFPTVFEISALEDNTKRKRNDEDGSEGDCE
jgi:hypothetical protein